MALDEVLAEKRGMIKEREMQKIWLRSGILEEYWPLDFKDYKLDPEDPGFKSKEHALAFAKEYATQRLHTAREKGIGIFFHGVNGAGKTLLGVCILKAAILKGYSAQFASLGTLVQTLTEGWYDDEKRRIYEDRIKNVDFLMIDDLGKEYKSKTGLVELAFDNIIRYRSFRNKPIIVTTNTEIDQISNTYGASVVSLLAGKFIPVKVTGWDFRKKVLSKDILQRLRNE